MLNCEAFHLLSALPKTCKHLVKSFVLIVPSNEDSNEFKDPYKLLISVHVNVERPWDNNWDNKIISNLYLTSKF